MFGRGLSPDKERTLVLFLLRYHGRPIVLLIHSIYVDDTTLFIINFHYEIKATPM